MEPIEGMLSQKQPNSHDLAALLPEVWWEGAEDAGIDEGEMKAACSSLEEAMAAEEKQENEAAAQIGRVARAYLKRLAEKAAKGGKKKKGGKKGKKKK